jgi:hypothetical protein
MKNKTKIAIVLIMFTLTLILTGFTTKTQNVLTYLKKMKVESVNYCKIQNSKPGSTLNISKDLEKGDLKLLIKLLNESESFKECKLPIPKGGFTGLILYMKSRKNFTFFSTENGFWMTYGNKDYNIVQPGYGNFLKSMIMKYTKGYN